MNAQPFNVGDEARCIATGGRVKITAINPPHPRTSRIRSGFTWTNLGGTRPGDKDHEGFCPASCAGGFELIPPPTTWVQRNLPTWWAWRHQRAEKARQQREAFERLAEEIGRQEFNHGWQEQDWPLAGEPEETPRQFKGPAMKFFSAATVTPTLEQSLAATIAGAALGQLRATPGAMIYHDSVTADALELARQIISQSEKP